MGNGSPGETVHRVDDDHGAFFLGHFQKRLNLTQRVVDSGPGIAPDVAETLFEPGVTTKSGGWGIGLALARRIAVDVHDGRLDIDPTAEETTFVLRLPKVAESADG